jgi:hypothetical protein
MSSLEERISQREEKRKRREQLTQEIRKYATEGWNINDIAELMKENISSIRNIAYTKDITIVRKQQGSKRRPEYDMLISQGARLKQIAAARNMTGEAARRYIIKTGQQEFYEQQKLLHRPTKKAVMPYIRAVVSLLKARQIQLAYQIGWAEGKTEEYLQRRASRIQNIPQEQLVQLFRAYEETQRNNTQPSYRELGKIVEKHGVTARSILASVGLSSQC